jgi:hypothetical protein
MSLERLLYRNLRDVQSLVVQRLFYSYQKVVGQDAEEYVSPHLVFQLVEDGALGQRAFHVGKGIFCPGEQGIDALGFFWVRLNARKDDVGRLLVSPFSFFKNIYREHFKKTKHPCQVSDGRDD